MIFVQNCPSGESGVSLFATCRLIFLQSTGSVKIDTVQCSTASWRKMSVYFSTISYSLDNSVKKQTVKATITCQINHHHHVNRLHLRIAPDTQPASSSSDLIWIVFTLAAQWSLQIRSFLLLFSLVWFCNTSASLILCDTRLDSSPHAF